MPQDLDLDLQSLWFTKTPLALPPALVSKTGQYNFTWSLWWEEDYIKVQKTLIAVVRWFDDLSATKIRITWTEANPKDTVEAEQQHYPPPAPLSEEELDSARDCYGERIARYCESRIGHQVGDGECWTLAQQALQHTANDCRSRGEEPVMVSQGKIHGYCILTHVAPSAGSTRGMLQLAGVARGDIVQIKWARFRHVDFNASFGLRSERNITLAAHTAIVVQVKGDVLEVLEQNTQFGKTVSE